jgi:glutaconate CoA-transferase subunit A
MKHLQLFTDCVNADPVEGMKRYLDRFVYGPSSWADFLERLGMDEVNDAARCARELHRG